MIGRFYLNVRKRRRKQCAVFDITVIKNAKAY